MEYILVVFASSTTAGRVRSLLKKQYDIEAIIEPTPAELSLSGCSYCLKTQSVHADLIWNIVNHNGLSSKGIYRYSDYSRIK